MGLFKRKMFKADKSYDITESLNILETLRKKGIVDNFTLEPDENGKYKFIEVEVSRQKEERIRRNTQAKRNFYDRVNGDGEYRNISVTGNHSNIGFRNSQSLAR